MTRRVLLVENENNLTQTLNPFLLDHGFTVTYTEAIDTAIRLIMEDKFDLVICEHTSHGLDTLGLIIRLRDIDQHVPVIIVSRIDDTRASVRFIREGAYDYLIEPVAFDELVASIDSALLGARLRDARYIMPENANSTTDESYGSLKDASQKAEMDMITRVLSELNNNKTKAAKALGIDRKTLYNKLKGNDQGRSPE